jgi:hypothetical protein
LADTSRVYVKPDLPSGQTPTEATMRTVTARSPFHNATKSVNMALPAEREPKEPRMESIPYPNHGRHVIGAERERYAKIAAERYSAGATIQAIASELGRSASFVNGLLHRDTDVKIRPRSVSGPRATTSDGGEAASS